MSEPENIRHLRAGIPSQLGGDGVAEALEYADALRAEVERLRAALERYGRHIHSPPGCGVYHGPNHGPCTCGLDAALVKEKP